MFILSNKKILAVVAMAACMATLANAEGTRAHARRRQLKSVKSSKKDGLADLLNVIDVNKPVTNINADTNSNTVSNAFNFKAIDQQCPDQAGTLSCSAQPLYCKICIVGQANFKNSTWQSMKDSCLKINGGYCNGCEPNEILGYYNCGTGRNMTETTVATPSLTTPADSGTTTTTGTTGVTTPATPTDPITVDIQSGSFIEGGNPDTINGGPPCPWDKPVSGTACDTNGYEWATCYYTGINNECSCRHDQKLWSCVEQV